MPSIQNNKSTLDYLGTIGSNDRGDSLKLSNSAQALVTLAGIIIGEASDNLDKGGNTATGKTASSMKATNIVTKGTNLELDIQIASTYKFLNDGVKGWKSGKGKYQFKKTPPGKKMVGAIKKWIKVRSIVTKYKAISANESKNKKISKDTMAYAMAVKVKRDGIEPTKFFTKALATARKEQKRLFADALKLDIIESLNDLN